jgi:hypothetical protein
MQELNERLSNPPDVNPANTEQLGLFVVGQLARRHGITVTLRPSPYGGTTAVVMISQRLIVDDSTPAIASGPGNGAAAFGSSPGGFGGPSGAGGPGAAGPFRDNAPRAYGAVSGNGLNGSNGFNGGNGFGDSYGNNGANGNGGHGGPPDLDHYPVSSPFGAPGAHSAPGGPGGAGPDGSVISGVPVSPATRPSVRPSFDPFSSQLPGAPAPDTQGRPSFPSRGGAGFGGEPSRGGSPFGDGPSRGGGSPSGGYDTGGLGAGTPFGSGGSFDGGSSPFDSGSPFDDGNSFDSGPRNSGGPGNNGGPAGAYPGGEAAERSSDTGTDYKGLPRRQRQANIAPQLRASSGAAETNAPPASTPNPADVKNTLSAMQRGWQQGRSQSQRDTEER